ncbi:DUF3572 domain-containing protein [Rhodobacteraceae bacterium 2376]|uniref:DUF3572 domain-containing protein n=1 Tax=Rhabdonatronobacter sediminivivens TaxID=2743469 RepID=A0A7Z0HW20_9RHOB|nr:DUF3572 domain-containing protein [Rhabdonatronobacter sediminivivens]NYS23416.1 DUF3572 domain-containing protein [Rhabdonatronobacter sediminivivens]
MTPQAAETIALSALAWLAGHDELWPVFMGSTGADVTNLRAQAQDPEFLAAVLDFILMDDAWITECTAALEQKPEVLARARAALPGGAQMHWT